MRWIEQDGLRWLEADLPGAKACFTTRLGGVSDPPCESLNLGFHAPDREEAVAENRRRLAGALGLEIERVASARQVHGTEIQVHRGAVSGSPFAAQSPPAEEGDGGSRTEPRVSPGTERRAEADGQVVTAPGSAAAVLVADCLPVALAAGPSGESGTAAMLHCGWRPLAGGIVERGVELTGARAAAIGPGIGPCCYEVGPEVGEEFEQLLGPESGVVREDRLDLAEAAEQLLRRAGVEEVERSGLCTSCRADLFYSHRRDRGRTGRQAGVVWMSGHG